jgi:hypothetical protein
MEKEHLEMILEDISGKFDLVLEGHAALDRKMTEGFSHLNEKIETNSFKIDVLNKKIDGVEEKLTKKIDGVDENLSKKIDGVAAELRAHRADTEAHGGVYGVRED